MKKILALLLTILLITIAFASCNLDGTSGIFREIALSKAPLSIRYKQLLGNDTSDLYFRTAKGVERVNSAKVNTTVIASKYEHIIQDASWIGDEVLYIINNVDESNKFYVVDTTNLSLDPTITTVIPTTFTPSELAIKNLYANSMILVTGINSGNKVFQLLKYVRPTFGTSVAEFTFLDNDYELSAVIQQTTKEQDANAPMIVSFVKSSGSGTGTYLHYIINPSSTTPIHLTGFDDVQIANFMYDSTNYKTYVLTTDGILYYAGPLTGPILKVKMITSDKTYLPNAFAYGLHDTTPTGEFHIITKPSTKTSSLYVFTFPDATITSSGVSLAEVKTGYASKLSLATIMSAQEKTAGNILVATDTSGMFEITIDPTKADLNDSTNGSSLEAEEYTFL